MNPDNEERQFVAEEPPVEAPFVPVSAGDSEQATEEELLVPALNPDDALDMAIYNARPGDNDVLTEPGAVPRPSGFTEHNAVFGGNARNLAIFICNYCKFYVRGGVVTTCGHLFCWTCLWPLLANKPSPECPRCRTPLNEQQDLFPFNARPGEDPVLAEPGAVPRPLGIAGNDEDDLADHDAEIGQFEVVNRFALIAMRIDSTYLKWIQRICIVLIMLVYSVVPLP